MLKRLHKAMKLLRITEKLNRQGWRLRFLTRWGPRFIDHKITHQQQNGQANKRNPE